MKTSRMLNQVPKIKNLYDSGHDGSPSPLKKLAALLGKDRLLEVSGEWPPFSSSGEVSVGVDMAWDFWVNLQWPYNLTKPVHPSWHVSPELSAENFPSKRFLERMLTIVDEFLKHYVNRRLFRWRDCQRYWPSENDVYATLDSKITRIR